MQELINDSRTLLVDVRTAPEVAQHSVPGAENIPLNTIPENLERFKKARVPIVLFCHSGARSENARQWLAQNGVEDVYNAGGIGEVLIHKM